MFKPSDAKHHQNDDRFKRIEITDIILLLLPTERLFRLAKTSFARSKIFWSESKGYEPKLFISTKFYALNSIQKYNSNKILTTCKFCKGLQF